MNFDDTSDDDSISTTSTAPSDYNEDYAVEKILAERYSKTLEGEKEYLVKWEGYEEHRNSWEPRENFHDPETLLTWEASKARQEQGLEPYYDIDALEALIERIANEKKDRQQRRRAKRRRQKSRIGSRKKPRTSLQRNSREAPIKIVSTSSEGSEGSDDDLPPDGEGNEKSDPIRSSTRRTSRAPVSFPPSLC
jgi:Chromo (CHRromatin Organisation MOdifier) domain